MNKLVEGNLACVQVRRRADACCANSCRSLRYCCPSAASDHHPAPGCSLLSSRQSRQGKRSLAHCRQGLSRQFKWVVWANALLPSPPKCPGERTHKPCPWPRVGGWQRTVVRNWAQWRLPAGSGGRALSIGFDYIHVYIGKLHCFK